MAKYPRLLANTENPLKPSAWVESDQVEFAYWLPNVSGGQVITNMPMETDWSPQANIRYAQDAEASGFAMGLAQTRWLAGYGADHQLEAFTIANAVLQHTQTLEVITACHPGLWHPAIVAKMQASLDCCAQGRTSINIASGWFKEEYTGYGLPWLEHTERYRRSEEFIRVLKGMWTQDTFTFYGDFYQINSVPMLPKPLHRIVVFQGGNSKDARRMAGHVADVLFMNGNTNKGFREIIEDSKAAAVESGRDPDEVKFGCSGFCIVRDTMEEAADTLRDIIMNADVQAVKSYGEAVKQAGRSSKEGEGMWTNSTFEDLIQYNDGFKTGLIGTPESVADRIIELKQLGIKVILTGYLHYDWELRQFGEKVIPLVREKEEDLRKGKSADKKKSA